MEVRTSYDRIFVDGAWRESRSGETTEVVNPATGSVVGTVPAGSGADAEAAVIAARTAFDEGPWPRLGADERARVLYRFMDALESVQTEIGAVIRAEAGALDSLIAGVHFGVGPARFRYAVDASRSELGQMTPLRSGPDGIVGATAVLREPVGVVAAITPFNFPLYLNLVKLGPALAAGNTLVLKPSPLTPLEGLIAGAAAEEAGLPPGVVNVVTGGADVGEGLVTHPAVDMVSFTGSDATGARIVAATAPSLKRVVLELGGKSALVVRADADVDAAATTAFASFTLHAGQGCVLLTRHIVHQEVVGAFVDAVAERAGRAVIGDPGNPSTTLGPLVSEQQRQRVHSYVEDSRAQGASIRFGGEVPAGPGFFYPPTLIEGLKPDARAVQEEIFGPVAVVLPFADDDEAVRLANDTKYGLSGAIMTADAAAGWDIARRMRTGAVRLNGGGTALDPEAPSAGWKHSGIGSEHGVEGLLEYTITKSISFRVG